MCIIADRPQSIEFILILWRLG